MQGNNSSLMQEKDNLQNEVNKLRRQVNDQNNQINSLMSNLDAANAAEKSLSSVSPLSAGPSSGNLKQLQAKVKQFEKLLAQGERERADIKTKLTVAESQKKALEDHFKQQNDSQNQKIKEMKDQLRAKGVDVSRY